MTPPEAPQSPADASTPTFADVPDRHRYLATIDGQEAGYLSYEQNGSVRDLQHTRVYDEFGGRGLGMELIGFVVADIRSRGEQLLPTCPFVRRYLDRHPEDAELVAV